MLLVGGSGKSQLRILTLEEYGEYGGYLKKCQLRTIGNTLRCASIWGMLLRSSNVRVIPTMFFSCSIWRAEDNTTGKIKKRTDTQNKHALLH